MWFGSLRVRHKTRRTRSLTSACQAHPVGVRLLVWGRRTSSLSVFLCGHCADNEWVCTHKARARIYTIHRRRVHANNAPCAGTPEVTKRPKDRERERETRSHSNTQRPAAAKLRLSFSRETSCRELMPCAHQAGRFQLSQTYVEIIGRFMRRTPAAVFLLPLSMCLWLLILRK